MKPSTNPSSVLLPPLHLHITGCPSRYAPARPCDEGTGRRFSILPAGFGCEVWMDA
ncbi:MAG: hypothetical protein K0A89_01230 [ANME-2 cluster archaeon]|nr:hypothetical protein [ANME-2 cluster archaeon]